MAVKQNRKQRGNRGKAPNPLTEAPTPQSVRKESRAATQTKFRPLERAIGAEVRASKQRTKQVGNWWQNYLDTVSGAQSASDAAYAKAGQEAQGFIDQAGARDTAQSAALQAEAAKNAELRGATPGTEAANLEAAGAAQRQYLSAATGAKTAIEGASQHTYLADKKRIGVGQSIASRKEEQRRTRSTEKDRTDTRGERGAYRVTKEAEGRDKARAYLIQRRAFGLEKKEAGQKARESAREAREDAEENRRKNEAQRNENTETGRAGKNGGLTPSEKHGKQAKWNNARSTAKTLFERGRGFKKPSGEVVYGPKWGWRSWAELTAAVEDASEVPPAMARKAVEQIRKHEEKSGGPSSGIPANEANPHGR